jgi:hypothetical protein
VERRPEPQCVTVSIAQINMAVMKKRSKFDQRKH